jgi:hypothetical protein
MSANESAQKTAFTENKAIFGVAVTMPDGIYRDVLIAVPLNGGNLNAAIETEIKLHIPDGDVYDWRQVGTTAKGISQNDWDAWELGDCEVLY